MGPHVDQTGIASGDLTRPYQLQDLLKRLGTHDVQSRFQGSSQHDAIGVVNSPILDEVIFAKVRSRRKDKALWRLPNYVPTDNDKVPE
jgi:hypothetical protein